eukprot:5968798-Heterocapsa_arctica.AAC.1
MPRTTSLLVTAVLLLLEHAVAQEGLGPAPALRGTAGDFVFLDVAVQEGLGPAPVLLGTAGDF